MIKIHEKLWFVKGVDREDDLAYMCQYAEDKDGNVLSNVVKMQSTGRSWASVGTQNVWKRNEDGSMVYDENKRPVVDHVKPARDGEEGFIDNIPTKGFYVGSSVSRWSTSNKLFRVKDPRGFTVEIPTDNLATLLHHTTVINGIVQEECVWGREGNNHILLPVNSEPYLITLEQMDTLENKLISIKDLKVGDWVKLFDDDNEYYYAGKIKGTWKIRGYSYETSWSFDSYGQRKNVRYSDWVEVKDDKWTDVFLLKCPYHKSDVDKYSVTTFSKPKIVSVLRHEPMALAVEQYSWYCPQRVVNKTDVYDRWSYAEKELISVEEKK